jgi:hypothetical protein
MLGVIRHRGMIVVIVQKPGGVEDTVVINRGQVLACLAMNVQIDRHRPAAAAFHYSQLDSPIGGSNRLNGAVRMGVSNLGNGNGATNFDD